MLDLKHYPGVASVFIVISRVLWSSLGTLNFLGSQTEEPNLWIIHDFLLLKLRHPILEVLQCLCNRKYEEEDRMSHYRIDLPNAEDSEKSSCAASMLFLFHQGNKNISYIFVLEHPQYIYNVTSPCLCDSVVLYSDSYQHTYGWHG